MPTAEPRKCPRCKGLLEIHPLRSGAEGESSRLEDRLWCPHCEMTPKQARAEMRKEGQTAGTR